MLIASVFNYERLDILQDSIRHPSKNLLSFEFAHSFCFQLRSPRYITRLNRTSELKVIVIWICYELPFSITSVTIYYGTQSDIWVKSYSRLNLLRSSIFNYEHLDILPDSFGHPCKKFMSSDFAQSFCSEFRASRYTTKFIRKSELKVIVVWICYELLVSITSISIYYGT